MPDIKKFESLLNELVTAKRLSASKLPKLSEMAIQLVKEDTQLVSILYKTHKSIESSKKVSSLYVFDAIARAARHQAKKHSLPVKELAPDKPGHAGSLLFKMQGVLDGLVEDMIAVGTQEALDKTRKVLEIWTKGNTFSTTVLSTLVESVKNASQEPTASGSKMSSDITTPISASNTVLESISPMGATNAADGGVPSSILALLEAQQPQVPPIQPTNPTIDEEAMKIALLQQLAAHVTASSGALYASQPPQLGLVAPSLSPKTRVESIKQQPRNGEGWRDGRKPRSRSASPPARKSTDPRLAAAGRRPTLNEMGSGSSGVVRGRGTDDVLVHIGETTGISASHAVLPSHGLDTFNFSTFDATSPESWLALSNAFKISNNREPTQEELMSIVSTRLGATLPTFGGPDQTQLQQQPQQQTQQGYHQQSYQSWHRPAYPPQQILTWERREEDELKRGNRMVGHGSYDALGLGHTGIGGRRGDVTDAIILCGSPGHY